MIRPAEPIDRFAGTTFDWDLLDAVPRLAPVIVAGGLTPENVGDLIRRFRPFAVDVSSGVESAPGIKDHDAIEAFVAADDKRGSGAMKVAHGGFVTYAEADGLPSAVSLVDVVEQGFAFELGGRQIREGVFRGVWGRTDVRGRTRGQRGFCGRGLEGYGGG